MDDFLRSKDGHRNMKPSNSVENTSSTNSEESEASFETIVRRNSTRERRSLRVYSLILKISQSFLFYKMIQLILNSHPKNIGLIANKIREYTLKPPQH